MKKNKQVFDKNVSAIIYAMAEVNGRFWFSYKNAIYSYDTSRMEVTREYEIEQPNAFQTLYYDIVCIGKKLVLSPFCTKDIAIYNMETQHMDFLDFGSYNQCAWYRNIVVFKEKIFILPGGPDSDILVVDRLKTVRYIHIDDWMDNIKTGERTSECVKQDEYLWVTAYDSNQVLKLNMDTETCELIKIDDSVMGYTGITIDNEYIWLAESNTGALIRYNFRDGEIKKIFAPDNLDYNSAEKSYVHLNLFNFNEYIISIPELSNKMTKLDKKNLDLEVVEIDFFDSVLNSKFNYWYGNYTTSNFGKKIDETTLWVQRTLDGKIASINIEDFSYSTFDLEIKDLTYNDMYRRIFNSENMNMENGVSSLKSFVFYLENQKSIVSNHAIKTGMEIWRRVI